MNSKESTHVMFDGEKAFVSSNLVSIFKFLIGIAGEIEELIGLEKVSCYRSQMICLFAYMETIFCLMTIYNHEMIDEQSIINFTNKDIEKLIKEFVLSGENEYYRDNKNKLSKISAKKLKRLRNDLTHFYSVSKFIQIVVNDKNRKIENLLHASGHDEIICISPKELYDLLGSAVKLILNKRTKESAQNPEMFAKKFECVRTIVDSNASILFKGKN